MAKRSFPTMVWVVEAGCYESRMVEGIYTTLKNAMGEDGDGWTPDDTDGSRWSNGLDWDLAKRIFSMDLQDTLRPHLEVPREECMPRPTTIVSEMTIAFPRPKKRRLSKTFLRNLESLSGGNNGKA